MKTLEFTSDEVSTLVMIVAELDPNNHPKDGKVWTVTAKSVILKASRVNSEKFDSVRLLH